MCPADQTRVRFFGRRVDGEHVFGHTDGMDRTRVRLTRIAACLMLGGAVVGIVGSRASAGASQSRPASTYVVKAGDTLWSIAARVVGPTEDPRPAVDRIAADNHIRGALLIPGERLTLPAGPPT
jgi:hypothetical protein